MRLLVALAAALALAAPAGGLASASPAPGLFVFPLDTRPGVRAETDVDLMLPGGAASVTVDVPEGYSVDPAHLPGSAVGTATLVSGGRRHAAELFVSDPSTSNCVPGPHAAVWAAATLGLSVAVDSHTLVYCLPPRVTEVDLDLNGVLTNPRAAGSAAWRATVGPAAGAPVELWSLVAFPQVLSLRPTYQREGSLTLSGRLVAAGRGRSGVNVHLALATRDDLSDVRDLGVARTRADGSYSLKVLPPRKPGQLTVIAYVNFYAGPTESIAPPPPRVVSMTIPRPGTRTAGDDPVPKTVKKERSERLRAFSREQMRRRWRTKIGHSDLVLEGAGP